MDNNYRKHPNSRNLLNSWYFPRNRQGESKSNMDRWADLARYRKAKSWYQGEIPRKRSKTEIVGGLFDGFLGSVRFLGGALVVAGLVWLLFGFFF